MGVLRSASALVFVLFVSVCAAHAQPEELRGVALVIGNGEYEHIAPLANPPSDADAVEELLSDLGFDSVRRSDRDARDLARDLERFVEDAEGADVAVLYYAGHGIEAGGENWLVPVDADFSALDDAAERLVPLSAVIERLQATVPVAIVLLDACRDNPFPPDALVRPTPDAAPVAISSAGLAPTRGGGSLGRAAAASIDNVGTVIGFAAEPGERALDGDPGGNSPYAAALVRHFDAMAGEEFGLVMRMVAEEVYLKTGGRQRPWVNESLRRLLYFGDMPDPVEGPDGRILQERRSLLVTISALPQAERAQVERVAADAGLPMDALYGMLRALGTEAPDDPAALEQLLRSQTEQIREMRSDRAVVESTDPEIVRLSGLADTAFAEGAMEAALSFHEDAKARVRDISQAVDDEEANIRARRAEFADVFAASAEANYLAFRYEQAASDYEEAFRQIDRWDDFMAWSYRGNQAQALQQSGWKQGAIGNLMRSVEIGREVVAMSERLTAREMETSRTFLGNALVTLGQRLKDPGYIDQAREAYEAVLAGIDPETRLAERIDILHNIALTYLGLANAGLRENYATAIARLEEIEAMVPRDRDPALWARTATALGHALDEAGRAGDPDMLRRAVAVLEAALEIRDRDGFPDQWRETAGYLANSLSDLAIMEGDAALLARADTLYGELLQAWDRASFPVDWAAIANNRSIVQHHLFLKTADRAWLVSSLGLARESLAIQPRADLPLAWAGAQSQLGAALVELAAHDRDAALLDEAMAAFDAAGEVSTFEAGRGEWFDLASRRAKVMTLRGRFTADPAAFAAAFDIVADGLAREPAPGREYDLMVERLDLIVFDIEDALDEIPADVPALLVRAGQILPEAEGDRRARIENALGRAVYEGGRPAADTDAFRAAVGHYDRAIAAAPGGIIATHAHANRAIALTALSGGDASAMSGALDAWQDALATATDDARRIHVTENLARHLHAMAEAGDHERYVESAERWAELAALHPADAVLARATAMESRAVALHNHGAFVPDGAAETRPLAIDAYRETIALYDAAPDAPSTAWRMRDNLASLLKTEGDATGAAEAYREAAREWGTVLDGPLAEAEPADRPRIEAERATALTLAGLMASDAGELAEGVALLRPHAAAGDPAARYRRLELARGLEGLGRRTLDDAALAESAAIARELVATSTGPDAEWEVPYLNGLLSRVLVARSDLELAGADAGLDEAVDAARAARETYRAQALDAAVAYAEGDLASALVASGKARGDMAALAEGAALYDGLLAASDAAAAPRDWAATANGLAYATALLARADRPSADTARAVDLARRAHAHFVADGSEMDAAHVGETLCMALVEHGRVTRDAAAVEEALGHCAAARTVFEKNAMGPLAAIAARTVERAEKVLAGL